MVALNSAQFGDDLLGAVLTVLPEMRRTVDVNEQLKRERATYRQATRNLIERVDREADERKAEVVRLVARASLAARRVFAFRRTRWRGAQDEWQYDADGVGWFGQARVLPSGNASVRMKLSGAKQFSLGLTNNLSPVIHVIKIIQSFQYFK